MKDSDFIDVFDEAIKALNSNDFDKATELFTYLYNTNIYDPAVINNLATIYHLQDKYELALDILKENLNDSVMNPFARALASQIYNRMGDKVKAMHYLKDGIRQFDWGVRSPEKMLISDIAWKEYTVVLKRAAGMLREHRLVIDLHNKWEKYYQTDEDYYQVGVAFFNLGYHNRAVKPWTRLLQKNEWGFIETFIDTLNLFEYKILPSFELEYQVPVLANVLESAEDFNWDKGVNRLFMLGISLFANDLEVEARSEIIRTLIVESGDWGIKAAHALLQSNSILVGIKMSAGIALTELGVFKKNEPIPMMIDGEERLVDILHGNPFEDLSAEERKVFEEAQVLANAQRYQEALDLIDDLLVEKPVQYHLVIMAGKLNALLENELEARSFAEQITVIGESEKSLLVYAAEIYALMYETEMAMEILNQLDEDDIPDELQPQLERVENNISRIIALSAIDYIESYEKLYIIDELEKPLPKQKRLNTCLRNLPVEWLDGISLLYGIELAGQRKEREKLLIGKILDPSIFRTQLRKLSRTAKKLISELLANDCELFLDDLNLKYGDFTTESYWWTEEEFCTELGEICRYGFAFVGTLTKLDRSEYGIIVSKEVQALFDQYKL